MNNYSFFTSITLFLYFLYGLYILIRYRKNRIYRNFSLLILSLSVWTLGLSVLVLPENRNQLFWTNLSNIGWFSIPCFTWFSAFHLTHRINYKENWVLYFISLLPVIFITASFIGLLPGAYFITESYISKHEMPQTIFYIAFLIYFILSALFSIGFIIRWGKNSSFRIEIKRAQLFISIISLGIISISFVNIIQPLFQIRWLPVTTPSYIILFALIFSMLSSKSRHLLFPQKIKIEEVVNNLIDIVIITDIYGKIITINKSVHSKLGFDENKLIDESIGILFEQKEFFQEDLAELKNQFVSRLYWEINCKSSDQNYYPFSFVVTSMRNEYGDIDHLLFTGQDLRMVKQLENEISERNKAEEALRKLNESLEEKVAERTKEIEIYATLDTMTNVYNRRVGLILLEREMQRSFRERYPLTLCYVDIDNLKKINDNFGHQEGDFIIVMGAKIIKESIRASDIVCRLGGDEFLVILPHCNLSQSRNIWNDIVKNIDLFNQTSNRKYEFSVSSGFAEYDLKKTPTIDELIAKADAKMYKNKKIKH